MPQTQVQPAVAAHGQPADRPVLPGSDRPVGLVDGSHHVLGEVGLPIALGPVDAFGVAAAIRARGWGNDDHRVARHGRCQPAGGRLPGLEDVVRCSRRPVDQVDDRERPLGLGPVLRREVHHRRVAADAALGTRDGRQDHPAERMRAAAVAVREPPAAVIADDVAQRPVIPVVAVDQRRAGGHGENRGEARGAPALPPAALAHEEERPYSAHDRQGAQKRREPAGCQIQVHGGTPCSAGGVDTIWHLPDPRMGCGPVASRPTGATPPTGLRRLSRGAASGRQQDERFLESHRYRRHLRADAGIAQDGGHVLGTAAHHADPLSV